MAQDTNGVFSPSIGVAPQGVSINDNRRLMNFGERVSHLNPAASPFFAYLSKVAKKLADPAVMKRILPIIKKVAPKLAAKIAISTTGLVVPEGISTVLGAAGLLWSAYDLVQLANQVPEIYQALAEG